jgi:hypothetical protein
VHEVIEAPGNSAHAVAALAAQVAAVQVELPLLLVTPPLVLLPPPPLQATPPVAAKQMGAPSAKQQLAVNPFRPSVSSVHDCTVAPGKAAHAVAELVAHVVAGQSPAPLPLPPLLVTPPLLLLLVVVLPPLLLLLDPVLLPPPPVRLPPVPLLLLPHP